MWLQLLHFWHLVLQLQLEKWKILNMRFFYLSHIRSKVWLFSTDNFWCGFWAWEEFSVYFPPFLLSLVPISCCLNAPLLLQNTEMERAKEGGSGGGRWRGMLNASVHVWVERGGWATRKVQKKKKKTWEKSEICNEFWKSAFRACSHNEGENHTENNKDKGQWN